MTTAQAIASTPGAVAAARDAASSSRNRDWLVEAADFVWAHAELGFREHESAAHLTKLLADAGFATTLGIDPLPTAFLAEWATPGAGPDAPVIGFMPEYDALPGLHNDAVLHPSPKQTNENGHGCNHSLLGAACITAALAMRDVLESTGLPARLRVVGTPAEEGGAGKVYLIHKGVFDGCDVVLTWHPFPFTRPWSEGTLAVRHCEVRFFGRPSHAAINPWDGRSALDAALLFTHGLEQLREHIAEGSRIHYVFKPDGGGGAANVVPPYASLTLYLRHPDMAEVEALTAQVTHMIRGADRMAWRDAYGKRALGYRPPELVLHGDCANYWSSPTAVELMHEVLETLGPVPFNDEDQALARKLQEGFDLESLGLDGALQNARGLATYPGSTDVGDVSWIVPTLQLACATLPLGVSLHTRAATASAAQPYAKKGAHYAATALAACGLRIAADQELRETITREHSEAGLRKRWTNAIAPGTRPDAEPETWTLGPDDISNTDSTS